MTPTLPPHRPSGREEAQPTSPSDNKVNKRKLRAPYWEGIDR